MKYLNNNENVVYSKVKTIIIISFTCIKDDINNKILVSNKMLNNGEDVYFSLGLDCYILTVHNSTDKRCYIRVSGQLYYIRLFCYPWLTRNQVC